MSDALAQPGHLSTQSRPAQTRSWLDVQLISLATLVALLPPLAATFYRLGTEWLPIVLVSLLVAVFWQSVFALLRRRTMSIDGIVIGLAFALVAGPSASLWQAALALSFGVIVGEHLFGARGHGFLNPAIVGLAFLLFSFPDAVLDELNNATAVAVLPGALLLIGGGLISWRIVVSAIAGLIAGVVFLGAGTPLASLAAGSFAFALVFFVCDPVAAASTNPGRWFYGFLFGALAVLFAGGAPSSRSVVFAALLASVLAPLIDQMAIWFNVRRRRRRYG